MTFSSIMRPKSPRIVPGAASAGLVAPMSVRIFLTAPFAGNDHLDHGTAGDVLDQAVIEGLALVLGIVGRSLLGSDHAELHALDGQAGALDAGDNLAHVTIATASGLSME